MVVVHEDMVAESFSKSSKNLDVILETIQNRLTPVNNFTLV